jgi:hypothetical protein
MSIDVLTGLLLISDRISNALQNTQRISPKPSLRVLKDYHKASNSFRFFPHFTITREDID